VPSALVAIFGESDGILTRAVELGGGTISPVEGATALVWAGGSPVDLEAAIEQAASARWVQLTSAGVDDYLDVIARHAQLSWTCAKGVYADSVAEHALAMILALRRGFSEHARRGHWASDILVEPLLGSSEVVTILGGGGIAGRLADLLAPFGVRVRIVRRQQNHSFDAPHERLFGIDDLDIALDGARVLVSTLPLTEQTRGLLDRNAFARLAPGAIVINVGRGPVLVQEPLLDLLESGHLRGAGLDVTDPEPLPANHPLWSRPGCLITSHTSNPTAWRTSQLAALVQDNVANYAHGRPLRGMVDASAGY